MVHAHCMLDTKDYKYTLRLRNNIDLPLQKWLKERASKLCYTYIACLKVKREKQQDTTNSMRTIKLSISTYFGHHYAHHQESKTVSYCMRCSAWVCRLWLAVVLWRCVVSSYTRPQPTTAYTPRQNTACSRSRFYSPDDGHIDARNMLR